ncbi:hypothetical protein [Haloprofundus halobius]|uniref:hypothetical protein n=1 Tax=Haloprofundus halobius TaxID=2876194 RepID=UPI001CCB16FB|nr:hypothetical protein [Haloprofundus halobius]
MLESQYLALFALGSASLFATLFNGWHNDTEIFAGISLLTWGVVALRSDSITVVSNGVSEVYGAPEVQWVAAAFWLISVAAFIGSLTGRYPTDGRTGVSG